MRVWYRRDIRNLVGGGGTMNMKPRRPPLAAYICVKIFLYSQGRIVEIKRIV